MATAIAASAHRVRKGKVDAREVVGFIVFIPLDQASIAGVRWKMRRRPAQEATSGRPFQESSLRTFDFTEPTPVLELNVRPTGRNCAG